MDGKVTTPTEFAAKMHDYAEIGKSDPSRGYTLAMVTILLALMELGYGEGAEIFRNEIRKPSWVIPRTFNS